MRQILVKTVAILLSGLAAGCAAAADPRLLKTETVPIPAEVVAAPGLQIKGAVALGAADPRFGGLSGLVVDGTRAVAVSDRGYLVRFRLEEGADGTLVGAADLAIDQIEDPSGRPLRTTRQRDAEELAVLPDGSLAILFERDVRVGSVARDGARLRSERPLPGLVGSTHRGIEALAVLPDGRWLMIAEREGPAADLRHAWLGIPGAWQRLSYRPQLGFDVSGAAALPDGSLLVLERDFTLLGGFSGRLVRVPAAQVHPGAELCGNLLLSLMPPFPADNYEAVAVRRETGASAIFLVSDDNFFPLQRTILVKLVLPDQW